ncbi:hypothetical protein [Caudoviricetes sp.]|nr:hypothetical protein [Caudoviricetes sp.]
MPNFVIYKYILIYTFPLNSMGYNFGILFAIVYMQV